MSIQSTSHRLKPIPLHWQLKLPRVSFGIRDNSRGAVAPSPAMTTTQFRAIWKNGYSLLSISIRIKPCTIYTYVWSSLLRKFHTMHVISPSQTFLRSGIHYTNCFHNMQGSTLTYGALHLLYVLITPPNGDEFKTSRHPNCSWASTTWFSRWNLRIYHPGSQFYPRCLLEAVWTPIWVVSTLQAVYHQSLYRSDIPLKN